MAAWCCQRHQWRSRGYCRPGPNIYRRPYWCSRNTFANEIAAHVKVPPSPPPPTHFASPLSVSVTPDCRRSWLAGAVSRLPCRALDWKEGNVLFNDALNTFYLRLYGVRHMVKDHSDNERGNLLPPHRLLFPISSKGSFICIIPQTG